jgi:hypothetical protein
MTAWERLIERRVRQVTVTTVSEVTERWADEMAREFLKDPAVRTELQRLIQRHFGAAIRGLRANGKRRKKARKS